MIETQIEGRRIASIRIDNALLLKALGLPDDTDIRSVRSQDLVGQTEFLIQHPSLKLIPDRSVVPVVSAKVEMNNGPKFIEWIQ